MQQQPPIHPRPTQPIPIAAQPPHNYRAPYINGSASAYQTPQQQHPSPAGANANAVAADGMSGPWPVESKAIPQKHDQSPVPPPSSQPAGEATMTAPVALVPSPSQQMQAASIGPQTVPVKKMPEIAAAPTAPIAQHPQLSPRGLGVTPNLNGTPLQPPAQIEQPKSTSAVLDDGPSGAPLHPNDAQAPHQLQATPTQPQKST